MILVEWFHLDHCCCSIRTVCLCVVHNRLDDDVGTRSFFVARWQYALLQPPMVHTCLSVFRISYHSMCWIFNSAAFPPVCLQGNTVQRVVRTENKKYPDKFDKLNIMSFLPVYYGALSFGHFYLTTQSSYSVTWDIHWLSFNRGDFVPFLSTHHSCVPVITDTFIRSIRDLTVGIHWIIFIQHHDRCCLSVAFIDSLEMSQTLPLTESRILCDVGFSSRPDGTWGSDTC